MTNKRQKCRPDYCSELSLRRVSPLTFLVVLVEDVSLCSVSEDVGVAGVSLVSLWAHVDRLFSQLYLQSARRRENVTAEHWDWQMSVKNVISCWVINLQLTESSVKCTDQRFSIALSPWPSRSRSSLWPGWCSIGHQAQSSSLIRTS